MQAAFWHEMGQPFHGQDGLVVETAEGVTREVLSEASASPPDNAFHLQHWATAPGSLLAHAKPLPAPLSPSLTQCMLFSTTYWQTAPLNMCAVHCHQAGAAHTWYAVPARDAEALEAVVRDEVMFAFLPCHWHVTLCLLCHHARQSACASVSRLARHACCSSNACTAHTAHNTLTACAAGVR